MTKKSNTESPVLKQYRELKKKNPDAIILFRCGDFYETYDTDASVCSAILGITLTKRAADGVNMAGFPFHALDTYLPKLIRAGKRVAICDQIEDSTKLVKRGGEKPAETKPEESPAEVEQEAQAAAPTDAEIEALKKEVEEAKKRIKEYEKDIESYAEEIADYDKKVDALRISAKSSAEIIKTTLAMIGSSVNARLDSYYATCFANRLEYIKLKRASNISLNNDDVNWLISKAGEAVK